MGKILINNVSIYEPQYWKSVLKTQFLGVRRIFGGVSKFKRLKTRIWWFDIGTVTFFSDLASQINGRFIWLAVFIFVSGHGHKNSGSGSRLVKLQFIREIQFSQAWWNLVRLSLIVHQVRRDIAPLSTQIKPSLKNNSELLLTDIKFSIHDRLDLAIWYHGTML